MVIEKSKKKKLMPNWEGPFRVLKHLGSGNYKLEKLDGTPIANPGTLTTSISSMVSCRLGTEPVGTPYVNLLSLFLRKSSL